MDEAIQSDFDKYGWFGREFKGIQAGDVFSIPLSDGTYAFGRLMNAKDGATIAEFFRTRRDTAEFSPDILRTGRLFGPVGILVGDIEYRNRKRPWKVIHRDMEYYPKDLYDWQFYGGGGPGKWKYFTLRGNQEFLGPASDNDVENWKIASNLPQHPGRITKMIEKQLAVQGL